MGIAILLHVLAAIIWVGGMFFAWVVLRPIAAGQLEPPARLKLWLSVFDRFFPWVWVCVAVLLGSGFWVIFGVFGGFENVGKHIHTMTGLGLVMVLIFLVVYFLPYQRLHAAVAKEDWPSGGKELGRIRRLIGILHQLVAERKGHGLGEEGILFMANQILETFMQRHTAPFCDPRHALGHVSRVQRA